MPIKIPGDLPAAKALQDENIFVMDIERAVRQDIRPLHTLILNLMPTKITTETQLARLLGNTPLQIEIELLAVSGRTPKRTFWCCAAVPLTAASAVISKPYDRCLCTLQEKAVKQILAGGNP